MKKFLDSAFIMFTCSIITTLLFGLMCNADSGKVESKVDEEMNYGRLKWGMSPQQVSKAYDYQEPHLYSDSRQERTELHYLWFNKMLVKGQYFYANKKKLYLLIFQFGHIRMPAKGSNIVRVDSPITRLSKERMLHYFYLLKQMYSERFGKGKTTNKSKGGKLDITHIWETEKALWRITLETDKENYHRLYLTAWNKKLNDEMKKKRRN